MHIRSMLIVNPLREELLLKSLQTEADSLWFELEDGVHRTRKAEARAALCAFLRKPEVMACDKELTVRVSDIRTPDGQADVIECVRAGAPSVMLGKARSSDDLELALELIVRTEHESAHEPGRVGLWAMIETTSAVMNIDRIVNVPRLRGLHFGGGDLSAELGVRKIGITTSSGDWRYPLELLYAQERTVLAARAAGISVLDAAYSNYRDLESTRRAAEMAAQLGFEGAGALTPRQLPAIHAAFTPTESEVQWAKRVVDAAEEADRRGETVVMLDDELIEGPFVRSAMTILRRSRGRA